MRTFQTLVFIFYFNPAKSNLPIFFDNNFCSHVDCKNLGYEIFASLNTSINPCENFYEFSCGNWITQTEKPNSEPIWNHHLEVDYKINNRIKNLLENSDKSPDSAFGKASAFYKVCLNVDEENQMVNVEKLKILLDQFRGLLKQDQKDKKNAVLFEIVKSTKFFALHPIMKISLNIDYKNTSSYVIYIEPANFVFPIHILLNAHQYPVEINAYRLWIFESFSHVYQNSDLSVTKTDVLKIIEFEIKLAKMQRRSKMERSTVEILSRKLRVDFLKNLGFLLDKNGRKVMGEDVVVVKNFYYFKNLFLLLRRTDVRTIVNYLSWVIMKDFSRETNGYMRNLNFIIDRAVLGVKSDLRREVECVNLVKGYFAYAILPKYLNKYFDDDSVMKVEEMVQRIKIEFVGILRKNMWLSEETKILAMEKVKFIKDFVGYPRHLLEKNTIENHYKHYKILDNHFENILNLKGITSRMILSKFNSSVEGILWPSNIYAINAYYSILQNTIFIPLGLLEPPFYYKNGPSFVNFGALGSVIGHEISHSLDSTGRQANKKGIVSKWWPQEDISKYQLNTRCIINQYNNFNSNGLITVGENIADNIGLQIAFNAFKKLKETQKLLPYTNTQLFFISFAQMWCEISNREDLFNDEHSSVKNRVNGTVSNSKNFENDFKCSKNDKKVKCKLW